MSVGTALAQGTPVVFTSEGRVPQLVCEPGKELEGLELLEKKGIVTILRPQNGNMSKGSIQTYGEKPYPKDEEILKYYGWDIECQCPYELRHPDGSFASGNAAIRVISSLREDWLQEQKDLREQDEEIPEDLPENEG